MANEDTLRRLLELSDGWSDAFGEQVSKGTRNVVDLPAFYNFSEERYRFVENGTRVRDPDVDVVLGTEQDW